MAAEQQLSDFNEMADRRTDDMEMRTMSLRSRLGQRMMQDYQPPRYNSYGHVPPAARWRDAWTGEPKTVPEFGPDMSDEDLLALIERKQAEARRGGGG